MQMILQILKNTKSESSARVIKQMVSIFMSNNNSNNDIEKKFIKLIFDIISHYNNDNEFSIDDIEIFYSTINEIFGAADVKYYNSLGQILNELKNETNTILMGCAVLPHLRELVESIENDLEDEQS
eukprot:31486_1